MSTYNDAMQKLADLHFEEHNQEAATTRELAVWAIQTGRWEPPADLVIRKCQEDFATAMREQYIKDEQGRDVRAKHSARIRKGMEQQYLWADIRFAGRKHMAIAFANRRDQIVGDCRQLKRDADYYNSAHPIEEPFQMVLDFTEEVSDLELLESSRS